MIVLDLSNQGLSDFPSSQLIFDRVGWAPCTLIMDGNRIKKNGSNSALSTTLPLEVLPKNIIVISLKKCHIDRLNIAWFAGSRVRELDVSENRIQVIEKADVKAKLPSLRVLNMGFNKFGDQEL